MMKINESANVGKLLDMEALWRSSLCFQRAHDFNEAYTRHLIQMLYCVVQNLCWNCLKRG